MQVTNALAIPHEVFRIEERESLGYKRGSDISITELTSPPRQVALKRRHEAELSEDISDRMAAFEGKAMHYYLEHHTDGIHELKLRVKCSGWGISGRIDRYYLREDCDWTVQDFKYAKPYKKEGDFPKQDWIEQVNLYAVLLRANRLPVDALEVTIVYKGWEKGKVGTKGYPDKPAETVAVEMWPPAVAEQRFHDLVRLHQSAQGEVALPHCSPDERWVGWSRAHKREISRRCEGFCNVRTFCASQNDGQET